MIKRESAKSKNKRENALKLLKEWEEELKMKNEISEEMKKQKSKVKNTYLKNNEPNY